MYYNELQFWYIPQQWFGLVFPIRYFIGIWFIMLYCIGRKPLLQHTHNEPRQRERERTQL